MNTKAVKLFQTTPVGGMVFFNRRKYIVKETTRDHNCRLCAFKEMSIKCPFFYSRTKQRSIKPVCFWNQRPDKKSVYFVIEELVWTNPGKKKNVLL